MRREVNEKIKPLVITDNETGEKYTLEFNRDSIRWAEQRGFVLDDVSRMPMTKIPELFYYAFRMHHKNVARERTDRIIFDGWEGIGGIPDGVIERLGMLYSAPFEALTDKEESEKNSRVTVEF